MIKMPVIISRLLRSRIVLVVSVVVFVFLFFQLITVVTRTQQTNKNIKSLQDEVVQLQAEQQHLGQLQSFLQTDFFAEREARTKFGFQKTGEKEVIIAQPPETSVPPGPGQAGQLGATQTSPAPTISTTNQDNQQPDTTTQYQLWWRYFFE